MYKQYIGKGPNKSYILSKIQIRLENLLLSLQIGREKF